MLHFAVDHHQTSRHVLARLCAEIGLETEEFT